MYAEAKDAEADAKCVNWNRWFIGKWFQSQLKLRVVKSKDGSTVYASIFAKKYGTLVRYAFFVMVRYAWKIELKYGTLVEMATAQRSRLRAVVGAPRRAAWQLKSVLRQASAQRRVQKFFYIFFTNIVGDFLFMNNNGEFGCNYYTVWIEDNACY